MSISRLLSRPQVVRSGVNMSFERALEAFASSLHVNTISGMSQLFDEHGARGPIVTTAFAIYWTEQNPECRYEEL